MRRKILLAFAVMVLVLAAMAAKSLLISTPPVRAHNASGDFNAGRAKDRLAFILGDQRPHPADSAANDMVRARLVATLQHMGLKPVVRDQVACNDFAKALLVACARVHNVIAILGPPTGKSLVLSAHYDSVPVGPGAGDDGIGVATLLEVGSILKERPLKRPIMLLFNEGEELGLIGARAFLADPLSQNVDSLLNIDARGVIGPAMMFETSQPNAAAISAFASGLRHPSASSMSTDVARLIPNDTDATVYKERGWLMLNYGIIGNETRYHSAGDELAALDLRSLQHMGDQVLAVATGLGEGTPEAKGDRIFMDLLGRAFVQMPLMVGVVVFLVLLVLTAGVAWKRGATSREPAVVLAAVVAGGFASWLAVTIMAVLRAGTYWRAHPEITFVAIYATALLAILAILRTLGSNFQPVKLRIAFWLVFLLVGGALAFVAPGALIYFLIPPGVLLIGIGIARWYPPAEAIGAWAALILLYLTWGEVLAALEELFSPGPLWVAAPVAALMILPMLVEALPAFREVRRGIVLSFAGMLALAGWAAALATPAYSQNREQRFTIEHVTQFPSGRSSWSVLNDGASLPVAYSKIGEWKLGKLPFSDRKRWFAPAPAALGIKPPALQLLETARSGSERKIRLRLQANGSQRILLIAPENADIRAAGAGNFMRSVPSTDSAHKFTLSCTGRSCDGMELTIDQAATKPIVMTVVGSRNGLPPDAALLVHARPVFARPQYTPDETLAITHVRL
jgi:Peptidase family M28